MLALILIAISIQISGEVREMTSDYLKGKYFVLV